MSIVIVSLYKAIPPTSGVAMVTYNIAKYLSGERYLIQLGDPKEDRFIEENLKLINIKCLSENLFVKLVNLAFQLPNIAKKIINLEPDIIILEGASWAVYFLVLFWLIRLKRIKAKIIYHAHNVEYLLRRQKNNIIIALMTRLAEAAILINSDLTFSVSEVDALNFKRIYGVKPRILPNGADIETFDRVTDEEILSVRKRYNLNGKLVLFMGMTAFKPNKEAVDFIINDVFPPLVEKMHDIKLVVIGGKVNYRRSWLINPGTIPFTEVPAFVKACDVCVAPIFTGSGIRIKILEYMAAGKPVVSTEKGAEGINVKDGDNILVADNENEFIEKIICLLKNHLFAEQISSAGMSLVRKDYSWKGIIRDFNKTLNEYNSREGLKLSNLPTA